MSKRRYSRQGKLRGCKCRGCMWCEVANPAWKRSHKARIRRWRQDRDTQRVELLDIAERKG